MTYQKLESGHSKVETFLKNRSFLDIKRKKSREKNDLTLVLCQSIIGSNIMLSKLNNSIIKTFGRMLH